MNDRQYIRELGKQLLSTTERSTEMNDHQRIRELERETNAAIDCRHG
jgi:hypothetical protein